MKIIHCLGHHVFFKKLYKLQNSKIIVEIPQKFMSTEVAL